MLHSSGFLSSIRSKFKLIQVDSSCYAILMLLQMLTFKVNGQTEAEKAAFVAMLDSVDLTDYAAKSRLAVTLYEVMKIGLAEMPQEFSEGAKQTLNEQYEKWEGLIKFMKAVESSPLESYMQDLDFNDPDVISENLLSIFLSAEEFNYLTDLSYSYHLYHSPDFLTSSDLGEMNRDLFGAMRFSSLKLEMMTSIYLILQSLVDKYDNEGALTELNKLKFKMELEEAIIALGNNRSMDQDAEQLVVDFQGIFKFLLLYESTIDVIKKTYPGDLSHKKAQNELRENEAFVSLFSFSPISFENMAYIADSTIYAAFVFRGDNEFPRLVAFPHGNQLSQSDFEDLKTEFGSSNSTKISEKHYQRYFEPLDSHLQGVQTVFIQTAGIFDEIPIEALLVSEKPEKHLIDKYEINRTTIHDLSQRNDSSNNRLTNISIFDDPTFSPSGNSNQILPLYLDGKTLADTLLSKSNFQITAYQKEDATEANLREIQNVDILHINTHKSVIPIDRFAFKNYPNSLGLGLNVIFLTGSADFLSSVDTIRTNKLEGIVNGFEIGEMDLSGTELVVLSACSSSITNEWGKRDLGLVEAFQNAGARYVIATLWPINSNISKKFFILFYEHLASSSNVPDAFQYAKKMIRKESSHPYFWGSFILVE